MSVRLRIFSNFLTAILVLNAISLAAGFFLFVHVANPYIGIRLSDNLGQIAAQYFPLCGVIVLILTGVGASWVISVTVVHVIGPLNRLKHAASEIRDGNLGYELAVSGQDEFAEVAACFEQMRIRLKDTMRMHQNAETERRAMMASVTHDMKTPISSIIGYAEGILDGIANTPEKVREYADIIRKKGRSLQALSEDLSLLARLESDQLPLDKRVEDIGAIINELTTEFFLTEQKAMVEAHIPPNMMVCVDREKIARVIVNLFQNSLKYKKPEQSGPEIALELTRRGDSALLTISDNGIHVAHSDLPHLFDRFYRADESRGRQSGSGLGLSIARQLVHLHGGKIWVLANPDGGLTVNILLPLVAGGALEAEGMP